jgi:hypothetical protein
MRKFLRIILQFVFAGLLSINVIAQKSDCIATDSSQKKLYLNGDNFTLIDNALRCFKINSIAEDRDSIVRIWMLESDFPDTPTTWRVKMFEFGKRGSVPFATLHVLEWGYENDSSLPVKCIKEERMCPTKGWLAFEKDIRRLYLPTLYEKPLINGNFANVDFGMFIIQFLFAHNTYSVDFTASLDISDTKNILQFDHSKRAIYLLSCIEKHFSISLSSDSKGRDYLKDAMIPLNLNKESH